MSRLTKDTPICDLYHHDDNSDELTHWGLKKGQARENHKYIKREWKNGRWRYYYDWNELKSDVKSTVKTETTKVADKTLSKTTSTVNKHANNWVEKAKKAINKLYDDPDNTYQVDSINYEEKMAAIKETPEWKEIVARNDPEYVKKNSDGTTTYLVDDYVVKKKHPVLDIASDIAAGRKVDINEITKESTVAALKDYAKATVNLGMLAAGVFSTALTEKFKFQQGTYDDDIRELTDDTQSISKNVTDGASYVSEILKNPPELSPEAVENVLTIIQKGASAAAAAKTIDEGNVIRAAQVILESEQVQSKIGNNQYIQVAESALSKLSDEEIAALNLLLKQMRNSK